MGAGRFWLGTCVIYPQVPEWADGGYWSVEPVDPSVVNGGAPMGVAPGVKEAKTISWIVELDGLYYAVHRSTAPAAGVPTSDFSLLSRAVAAIGRRPFGRVNGV